MQITSEQMSDKLIITSSTPSDEVTFVDGRDVMITGESREVNLSGHCKELRVIGEGHTISAEEVDSLNLQGTRNQVQIVCLGSARLRGEDNDLEWRMAKNGQAPSLDIGGEGNSVSMIS